MSLAVIICLHECLLGKTKQNKKTKKPTLCISSLLIPLLPSPTSFQNNTFLCYKQTQMTNENNQTDGLRRLSLSGLESSYVIKQNIDNKGDVNHREYRLYSHARVSLCVYMLLLQSYYNLQKLRICETRSC